MKREDIKPMGNVPRSHMNCFEKYKVCRPGKTATDKAAGVQRFKPNRRIWDGQGPQDPKGRWTKV